MGLIWNLYFSVLRERTLGSTPGVKRRAGNLRQAGWRQFPALPSAPAVEPRVHIIDQQTNFQFGKFGIINEKKLIHVLNVLFGLRANEIPIQ
jgi:hypothetical protein